MKITKQHILKLFTEPNKEFPEHGLLKIINGKNIILYGAGDGLVTFLVLLKRRYKLKILFLLDKKFPKPTEYLGISAKPLTDYIPTEEEKKNSIVIITVGKEEFHKEIFGYLQGLGFKNIILVTDIYEYHLHYPPKELEEKGSNFYLDKKETILDSFKLFEDDESKEVFFHFLETHYLRKPQKIPNHSLDEQYFPPEIKINYNRVINCGAYNGDTVRQLNKQIGKVEALACFEPERNNFKKLSEYISDNENKIAEQINLFPFGVYSSEQELKFYTGNEFNSMISENGNDIVKCVSIDTTLPEFKPTFINMDIEGAELEALKGAEKTLKKYKPDLAVCVYHSPNHIWEIPCFLNNLDLGYKFYLRNYTSFISETVLYATINNT